MMTIEIIQLYKLALFITRKGFYPQLGWTIWVLSVKTIMF